MKQFPNFVLLFFSEDIYFSSFPPRIYKATKWCGKRISEDNGAVFARACFLCFMDARLERGVEHLGYPFLTQKKEYWSILKKNKNSIHKSMTELARYSDAVKFTAIFSKNYPPKLSLALSQSNFGINSNFWNQIFSHSAQL